MRMYVSGIEDENPDWYDLVTNDGDEERVREVAEAAAEAVAAAGMDAKAQLARLDDRGRRRPKGPVPPRGPRGPRQPGADRSADPLGPPPPTNLAQSVSRSSLFLEGGPAAGPRGGEDPVPGGRHVDGRDLRRGRSQTSRSIEPRVGSNRSVRGVDRGRGA